MNPFKKAKSNAKRSIARATGIPTTKSGRSRKAKKIENQIWGWVILIVIIAFFASGGK